MVGLAYTLDSAKCRVCLFDVGLVTRVSDDGLTKQPTSTKLRPYDVIITIHMGQNHISKATLENNFVSC